MGQDRDERDANEQRSRGWQPGDISGLSRRQFVQATGIGAASLFVGAGIAPRLAEAAPADAVELKVGFASPRSGVLAGFGECDGYLLSLVRKALANGIENNGKRYTVRIIDVDTQSDPARASQLARKLINEDKIDLMLATSTPEVVNPVSDACEAAAVPCLSTTVPWEAWYYGRGAQEGKPSPFKWTYHFSMGAENFFHSFVSTWNGPVKTNKKVGILYPNDADGNAMRHAVLPKLAELGFTIVDPGGYQDGTTDYSLQIAKYKAENCEIFHAWPIPPDFATFWRQAAQQGYTRNVKIAHVVKSALFPSEIEALGALGETLATSTFWHPTFPYSSRLLALSSAQLAASYEHDTGRQWNQQIGPSTSLLDAGVATLEKSTDPKDKAAVAKTLSTLKMECMLGSLDLTKGPVPNVWAAPMIGCQWVKAKPGSKYKNDLVLVEHSDDPKVPIAAELKPYGA
jgi:branched-chain amino acid transport system substrate-binding protein